MKIIISPAKTMKISQDFQFKQKPSLLEKSKILLEELKKYSFEDLKTLYKANDKITQLNQDRISAMNLESPQTPSIMSYEGLQFSHMAPVIFEQSTLEYAEENVRIISGLYGILRPFDGISPYRLEMASKMQVENCKNLYEFWGSSIACELEKSDDKILNLASSEYSKAVKPHISKTTQFLTVDFCEEIAGKLVQKGAYCKMARGEMVRFLATNKISHYRDIKDFSAENFTFSKKHSSEQKYIFLKGGTK